MYGVGRSADHAPAIRGSAGYHRKQRAVGHWRDVVAGAAVDRGSVNNDAFGIGIEVDPCIYEAEPRRLGRSGYGGQERSVVRYGLGRGDGLSLADRGYGGAREDEREPRSARVSLESREACFPSLS